MRLFVLSLLLFSCASHEMASPPARIEKPTMMHTAPTPYTAEQLRTTTTAGDRYEWEVMRPGKPLERRVLQFVVVSTDGAEFEQLVLDETGHQQGEAQRVRATWADLRDHAAFPRETTTLGAEDVSTPAGSFQCVRYIVRTEGGEEMRFWFSRAHPGAPVKMETRRGGTLQETRTLVRLVRSSASGQRTSP